MKSLWSLDDQEEVRVHLAHSFLKISQARERERQRDAFSRRGVTGYSELVSYTWLVLVSTPDLLRALLPSNRRQPGLDCSSTSHDGAASLLLRLSVLSLLLSSLSLSLPSSASPNPGFTPQAPLSRKLEHLQRERKKWQQDESI